MDDEPDLRMIVSMILTTLGYLPVEAKNGQEVLDLLSRAELEKDPFAAVILD